MRFIEDNPCNVNSAEIVVGIPSYNEVELISFPTQQADQGLNKYYSKKSAVIINFDNSSPDDTRKAFMETPTSTPKIYISTGPEEIGKGNNLKNLFQKAVDLDAKAIVALDADLRNVSPVWIRNLLEPIFDDYHYVAPLYARHKYEGVFTNGIVYPLTRSLYGRRVRQPIGGEVGFSGELAKAFMESDCWTESVGRFGITIWTTTLAMRSRLAVIQSFMGKSKLHSARDMFQEVEHIFADVMITMFDLMCSYENFWAEVKWSRPTAVFGFGVGDVDLPRPVDIDARKLAELFTSGLGQYSDTYSKILDPQNLSKLQEVSGMPQEIFEFPTGLWSKILYDYSVAYRDRLVPAGQLLNSLIPLYYGKTFSFVLETQYMNTQQVEEFIEDQCLQFEKTKPYLLERWFQAK